MPIIASLTHVVNRSGLKNAEQPGIEVDGRAIKCNAATDIGWHLFTRI